jgi:protein translocase SecG subunit
MTNILTVVQIVVTISLIALILLQAKGTGLDSTAIFGSGGGEFYSSKRGLEKGVFIGTIVLTVLFAGLSLALLLLK